jgi:hypothetical protein
MPANKTMIIILSVVGGFLLVCCLACCVGGFFVWRIYDQGRQQALCKSNLRNLVLGMQNHQDQRGDLPPLYIADPQGRPLHSWRVLLLPYMEQQLLFQQIRLNEPWDSEHNRQFHSQMPSFYLCPSSSHSRESGLTSYFSIAGEGAPLEPLTLMSLDDQAIRLYRSNTSLGSIQDGASNQIMVFEATGYSVNWMQPVDPTFEELRMSAGGDEKGIGSHHAGAIANAAMGDGLIVTLRAGTPPHVLRSLLHREDGQVLDYEWIQ